MGKRSSSIASAGARRSVDDAAADTALAKMGYSAELPRTLSMLSVLGLSFAIMAVPYGLSTTFYISLANGQSVTVIWGWVLLSLLSVAIAGSLAEICSVYPTSGGVYYWSALLATPRWAPIASWVTGWLNLVGNWCVTLSINFGGAQLILSAISLWDEDYVATAWQTVLMFWAVTLLCFLINVFGHKYLDWINTVCIYWTGASMIIFLVVLLAMSPTKRSGEFVFAHYDASGSGWPTGWAFFVGLLQPAYVLTGYGMVAAMCEEVQSPEREVPKAIVLSVVAAGLTGLVYLIPILFVLPDVQTLLEVANGQPIGLIFKTATGSAGGGFGLLFLILGIWLFAGVGALTASSRTTYAFSRDGAIPFSKLWSKVDKRFDIPFWALTLSAVVNCLLGLIYFGSTAAFSSFTGVATICLSTSYGLPILVSVVTGRKKVEHASFSLGRFGFVINIITLMWIILAIFLFCLPTTLTGLDASSMNYASVVFAGFAMISIVWYFVWGRKAFTGPPILNTMSAEPIGVVKGRSVDLEGKPETLEPKESK
ncbi:gaba permease [Pseudomassariella vexata]|uniref:Gaba permease n=1 Tax=Pseudomassariella vexata TaxID=1141098 RepID=A0A1Y2DTH9_9PEZI|nr:gaba permease [Pseudomassariella vexata]ORY62446.1 gaba permease [Pseudomassariella vexata]